MVRVGGGWDTLSHYLDKHDPCRCRTQHRTTYGAKLVNKPGATDLQGAQVHYDRSAPQPHIHTNGSAVQQKDHLGPPMNSINRSRSRSPSHMYYADSRRSVSPHFSKKTLVPPIRNRSRSPTPNFISTHTAKLSNGKIKNGMKSHVSVVQIPVSVDPKTNLKSEVNLQVSENLTDHSDNTSEVSDEGYRSLGLVQSAADKGKNRNSLCSQNSVDDVEDSGRRHSMDLNESGLRRTQFSCIYQDDSTPSPDKSRKTMPTTKDQTNNTSSGTWSGRQKCARPSLPTEMFSRNSVGRRSVSAVGCEGRKGSLSANCSPTKGRLRDELLRAVNSNRDDAAIAQQVKRLLKKYGSLTVLDDDDSDRDGLLCRNSRKDSKPDSTITKIPAPILHKA